MKKLGVEMTFLRLEERIILMQGMILRRLRPEAPLNRSQLDVAIGQDIVEIIKRFTQFKFEAYVGCNIDSFYELMVTSKIIKHSNVDGLELYERGPMSENFDNNLTEDMEWFIEELPMSTRGLFDQLKQTPDRGITMDVEEFMEREDQVIEDHRCDKQIELRDHQLRSSSIIRS